MVLDLLVLPMINSYYPDKCAVIDILNTETGEYTAALFKYEKGNLGNVIYSLPRGNYKTGEEAIKVLISVIEEMQKGILIMSN